jgi:hypothetical protein
MNLVQPITSLMKPSIMKRVLKITFSASRKS